MQPSLETRAAIALPPNFSGVVLTGDTGGVTGRTASDAFEGEDKLWRWASVSKQITAVLVMQDVEAGRVFLDDSLADLLPQADERHSGVTLRHLLQHTSGMAHPGGLPPGDDDRAHYCLTGIGEEPGTSFNYNNCETILAGLVLEELHGKPVGALMDERIFRSAGMRSAYLKQADDPSGEVRGFLSADEPEPMIDVTPFGPAGAVIGKPQDLVLFNAALMRGDLLGPEALETLWEGNPSIGYVALGVWSFSAPLAGCEEPVRLIERRGHIEGIQLRNLIAPGLERSLVVFTDRGDFPFGEIWQAGGAAYDLASQAFCSADG
jgi:CubicO group peptidase (beta-lactamase class C family)